MKYLLYIVMIIGFLDFSYSQSLNYNLVVKIKNGTMDTVVPVDSIQNLAFQNYTGIMTVNKKSNIVPVIITTDSIKNITFLKTSIVSMVVTKKYNTGAITIPLDSIQNIVFQNAFTLISPNGGEKLQAGNTHTIKWLATNAKSLKIEYTTNNGTAWATITNNAIASYGNYPWILPTINSTQCKVRISDASNSSITASSNSVFSINMLDTDFDVIELVCNPNPSVSEVEEGGTFYRYYQLVGKNSRQEVDNIPVDFELVGGNFTRTALSGSYSYLRGVLVFKADASEISGSGRFQFRLKSINNVPKPNSPIVFYVDIKPRKYKKEFEINREFELGLGIALGAGASFNVKDVTTPKLIMEKTSFLGSDPDSVGITSFLESTTGIEFSTETGAKFGAGPVRIGTYAGASAGVFATLEGIGNKKYKYETTDEPQKLARMIELSNSILSVAPVPVLSQIVNSLSSLSNWKYLESAEAGFGVKGSVSASAMAGIYFKGSSKREIGAGVVGDAGIELGYTLNSGYNRTTDMTYGKFSIFGKASASASAFLGWNNKSPNSPSNDKLNSIKLKSSLLSWSGEVNAKTGIGIYYPSYSVSGFNNTPLMRLSLSFGINDWQRDFTLDFSSTELPNLLKSAGLLSIYSIANTAVQTLPFPSVGKNYLSNSLDGFYETVVDRQFGGKTPSFFYSIDSSRVSISRGFDVDLDWAILAKLNLKGGFSWKEAKKATIERGVFTGLNTYALESYKDIPDQLIPSKDVISKIFKEGINSFSWKNLFASFSIFSKNMASKATLDNTYIISNSGSTINLNPASLPQGIDSLVCLTWNWYGNKTTATLDELEPRQRQISLSLKAKQQAAANLNYGIGGFYKFTPQAIKLSSPATMTIVFPETDVTGLYKSNLAIFYQDTASTDWKYIGGIVDSVNNKITVTVNELQLYTIAPVMPDGTIKLTSTKDSLINNGSVSTITSDTLKLSNGMRVGDGVLYTLESQNLAITNTDADTTIPGVQIKSINSSLSFQVKSLLTPGKGQIKIQSVNGTASGLTYIAVIDTIPPGTPVITSLFAKDSELRLTVKNQDTLQTTQYEVSYGTNKGGPYNDLSLSGINNSLFLVTAKDTITISSLKNDSLYYVVLKAVDVAGNKSQYSNEISGTPVDTIAPAKIAAIDFTIMPDSSYLARWTAVGDNANEGQANAYIIKLSGTPVADTNTWWQSAVTMSNIPSPSIAGNNDYYSFKNLNANTHYYMGIQVIDEVNNKSSIIISQISQNKCTRSESYLKGWNLVSLSVLNDIGNFQTLYPFIESGPYDFSSANGYMEMDTIKTRVGMWIKLSQAYDKNNNGTVISDTTISINQGWNLIGSNSFSVSTSSIITNPSNILSSVFYSFDSTGYVNASEIKYGKGYWIKASQPGKIILPKAASKLNKTEQVKLFDKGFRITAADSKMKDIWLVSADMVKMLDAPPFPPSEVLDIRYKSDRYGEDENSKSYDINISGAVYPIKIEINNMSEKMYNVNGVNSGKQYGALNAANPVIVDNPLDKSISLSKIEIPLSFYMDQNYPNPFNPLTYIKFGLPEETKVTIKIFDILGQEVYTLINEQVMKAGHHKIEWNASKYASGVYFYRIESSRFSSVKKMMLLK